MNDHQVISIDQEQMCLQQTIDGTLWRFYYRKIDNRWVRHTRVNLSQTH